MVHRSSFPLGPSATFPSGSNQDPQGISVRNPSPQDTPLKS
uniref:Uncharacterized protein n=1 Tax=Anguilla anguilla TaxID=7936 RepID=A0A0E9W362_ANGAN